MTQVAGVFELHHLSRVPDWIFLELDRQPAEQK